MWLKFLKGILFIQFWNLQPLFLKFFPIYLMGKVCELLSKLPSSNWLPPNMKTREAVVLIEKAKYRERKREGAEHWYWPSNHSPSFLPFPMSPTCRFLHFFLRNLNRPFLSFPQFSILQFNIKKDYGMQWDVEHQLFNLCIMIRPTLCKLVSNCITTTFHFLSFFFSLSYSCPHLHTPAMVLTFFFSLSIWYWAELLFYWLLASLTLEAHLGAFM